MRQVLLLLLAIGASLFVVACNEESPFPRVNCYEEAPDFGFVKIDASFDSTNTAIPVEFFLGDYNESRTTLSLDTLTQSGQEFSVPIGLIGIAVTYQGSGGEQVVVDSVRMRYEHDEYYSDGFDGYEYCESCCYSTYSTRIDMRR